MKSFTIGQAASRADVPIDTIRYYERTGLLPKPARRASGYREYRTETVRQLRFIHRAKELGFSLGEGFVTTAPNVAGRLQQLMREAGFSGVVETRRFATLFGTMSLYKGAKGSSN